MQPKEIRFKKGSVWVKTVQVYVSDAYPISSGKKNWLLYFSFIPPEKEFYGETMKDEAARPMTWDNEEDALKYAEIYFEYILG